MTIDAKLVFKPTFLEKSLLNSVTQLLVASSMKMYKAALN